MRIAKIRNSYHERVLGATGKRKENKGVKKSESVRNQEIRKFLILHLKFRDLQYGRLVFII